MDVEGSGGGLVSKLGYRAATVQTNKRSTTHPVTQFTKNTYSVSLISSSNRHVHLSLTTCQSLHKHTKLAHKGDVVSAKSHALSPNLITGIL